MNNTSNPAPEFDPGQIVFLKADPSTRGAVVSVSPGTPENQIHVFVGQKVHTYYPSQLQLEVQDDSRLFTCDYVAALFLKEMEHRFL